VPQPLCVDGSVTVYRLYDIGYAIALDRAADLLGERTRVRPSRLEARAIEIRNPPLRARVTDVDLTVGDRVLRAAVSAHLFDFGVCSLQLAVTAPRSLDWAAFAAFAAAVDNHATLPAVFDRALQELAARIAPAIERAEIAPLSEAYTICRVDRLVHSGAGGSASELLGDEAVATLLLGDGARLSAGARADLMPHRFSYYDDDLTVLTWESALVVEPRSDDRDVEYILEFANAQLLELRMYDQRLDADLPALYDRAEAARARRSPRLAGRFRALLTDLQTRVADITETVERVENALKVTDDVYLARVYAAALDVFREEAWRSGIDRKLAILRETYAMLNAEAQTARAELLEIAVVALIVIELVVGVLRGSH